MYFGFPGFERSRVLFDARPITLIGFLRIQDVCRKFDITRVTGKSVCFGNLHGWRIFECYGVFVEGRAIEFVVDCMPNYELPSAIKFECI